MRATRGMRSIAGGLLNSPSVSACSTRVRACVLKTKSVLVPRAVTIGRREGTKGDTFVSGDGSPGHNGNWLLPLCPRDGRR